MSEDQYKIRFNLLVPKFVLLRYDVFPFIFAYSALFYAYFNVEETDDSNLSIYLRLALIGVGFLNCKFLLMLGLTYIFGHWSKKMQALIQYRKLSGPYEKNLQKASHVYVYEKKQGYSPTHFISDFYKQQDPELYFFHFLQKKYYYSPQTKSFERLKPKLTDLSVEKIIQNGRFETPRQFYDDNILQIPIREFGDIFREQIIDPFAFFQLFSVFLWMLDSNVTYCIIILVMLLGSSYAISVQRIKTLIGYRSMTLAPHQVYVLENNKWIGKSSYELRPGDIISVTPGYQHKKVPHDSISDKEYLSKLIPFANLVPQKLMQQGPQKKQENTSNRCVPCDILLLSGGCIANESIMTGEAIPQIKESITRYDLQKEFAQSFFKQNILFCGTQILQVNDHYQEDELHHILDPTNKEKYIPKPPVLGCIGMVLTTGFETSKGKLIRKVIANAENLKIEQKDGLWIIGFLLFCSLITSAYVLDQGMDNEQRSKQKLFLRCILIITTVVPPQLPMILTLAVNNSIMYLQKKKIFVSEPKKIPLGGKVDTIAFDKTGTLTQDKFIFEGIVDDCQSYKSLKTLKNCHHDNICVLAGCHSLINVDKELTGDPIQLMFFDLSDWTYTSKLKEARRIMEKITILKIFPFKSELKRMSTLVEHVEENGTRKYKVLTKGAPQAIQKLLTKVPENYKNAYEFYTKQGYRLLALASKQVAYEDFSKIDNKDKERQFAECNLKFCGFFICNSPLKPDTLKNIENLQKAKYRLIIITGDNILTAIKVGLTLKFGDKPWIIQCENEKVYLNKEDKQGTEIQIESPQQLRKLLQQSSENVLLSTSSAKVLSPEYFPMIKIFARTSPHDKEVIIKKIKQIENCAILYAGDGSNDVGGLRSADVGVAVVGTTTLTEVEQKQEKLKQKEKEIQKKMKELQSDIAMPFKKKLQAMGKLNQERMMMMREKNMGFMMEEDIKVGDACIAAPFTSKHSSSIRCVLIIIRQSIATLVTTIQTYKILAISSMLQAYSLAEMNLINLKYSEKQMGFVGILASINFYYFSNAKPLKNISPLRAPHTIFNKWFAISFFGQIILFVFANYYALNHIGLKYVLEEDKKVSADMEFKRSFLNTVIFLFSAISQSAVFIVNHGGEPHMQSLLKNSRYFKFLIIPLVICFILTANIFPQLSEFADLKYDGIPYQAHVEMLIVFSLLVSSTYILDRLCRFAQYKQFIGWF